MMKKMLLLGVVITLLLSTFASATAYQDVPPGAIKLLPGYKHKAGQGQDTRVGKIWRDGGIAIEYDIGRLAGHYANPAEKRKYLWYKEQNISGREVRVALTRDRRLLVTFPKDSANFFAKVKTQENISDILLIVLTYEPEVR